MGTLKTESLGDGGEEKATCISARTTTCRVTLLVPSLAFVHLMKWLLGSQYITAVLATAFS